MIVGFAEQEEKRGPRHLEDRKRYPTNEKIFSAPSADGVSHLVFRDTCVLAKFWDGDVVMFFFAKSLAEFLQKKLGRTFAEPREVFNVFGEDDDALRYVGFERHEFSKK